MTTSIATTLQHNRRPLSTTLAVSAALAFSTLSGDLLRPVPSDPAILAVPYLRSALTTLCDLLVMLTLVWMASGLTPPQQLRGCGLGMPAAPALRWAAMVFAPATLGALLLASPAEDLGPADFIWPTLAAPQEKLLLHSVNWLTGRDDRLPRADQPAWSFPRVEMPPRDVRLWRLGTAIGLPLLAVFAGLMVVMIRRIR